MKCLSVSQPFADLIVRGKKTIELRTWNTKFRGEFLVHSPEKIKIQECKKLGIEVKTLRRGVIIGKAEIYDVKKYNSMSEYKSDYQKHFASEAFSHHSNGFLLRNARELKIPIPYKGSLGFFDINLGSETKVSEIKSELFDEGWRYQFIDRH